MTEYNPLQLSIFLGNDKYASPQLVIRADSTSQLNTYLEELTSSVYVDEIGEEHEVIAPISIILDNVQAIQAGVMLKFGTSSPTVSNSNTVTPNVPAPTPQPSTIPNCDVHSQPMKWVADGIVKNGQNAGKHYSAYQCSQPFQPGVKCGFKQFTIK